MTYGPGGIDSDHIRVRALKLAHESSIIDGVSNADAVVKVARIYEAYLRGDDD